MDPTSSSTRPDDKDIEITHSDYGRIAEHSALPTSRVESVEQGKVVDHTRAGGRITTEPAAADDLLRRFLVCLVLSLPVLLYSDISAVFLHIALPILPGSTWIVPLFSLAVLIYGGLPFFRLALSEVSNRQPGQMLPASLAMFAALIAGVLGLLANAPGNLFLEFVALVDALLIGYWAEQRVLHRASGSLQELAALLPDTAERVLPTGLLETIRVRQLKPGYLILVRPGDSIAADGEVVEGESNVDEQFMSGQSAAIKKGPGSRVLAGSVNGEGTLKVKVTAAGDRTLVANILRAVREDEQAQPALNMLASRAATAMFYLTLIAAVATAIAWTALRGWYPGILDRAAAVFAIPSSAAFALGVSLVVANSTLFAARQGILIRSKTALDRARNLDLVAFDKSALAPDGEPRAEGKQVASTLRRVGAKAAFISPQNEDSAHALAGELGIGRCFGEVTADRKAEKVRELQAGGKRVAFVSADSADDAALARADVGIAVAHPDGRADSAEVLLLGSNPLDVTRLIEQSRAAHAKMVQNVAWAILYNLVAVLLAAGLLAPYGIPVPPALAALVMFGSTILVALNARTF